VKAFGEKVGDDVSQLLIAVVDRTDVVAGIQQHEVWSPADNHTSSHVDRTGSMNNGRRAQ
jgi:hypothetical protein